MIAEAIIASVIAGTSVCSDHFDNVSRFNPTDLSDYQQCFHITNDNHSGLVGNNLWVRDGNNFVYIAKSQYAGRSQEAIKEIIVKEIIVERVRTEVTEDLTRIHALMAEINTLRPLAESIPALQTRITALEGEVSTHLTTIGVRDNRISQLMVDVQNAMTLATEVPLENAVDAAILNALGPNAGGIDWVFFVSGRDGYRAADEGVTIAHVARFIADRIVVNVPTAEQVAEIVPESGDYIEVRDSTGGNRAMLGFIVDSTGDGFLDTWIDDPRARPDGRLVGESVTNPGTHAVLVGVPTAGFGYVGTDRIYTVEIENLHARIIDIINDVAREAYNAGYEDGYRDGYEQGFIDGAASVTNN